MYKQHTCSHLDKNNNAASIIKEEGDEHWILYLAKIATEEDLENNHHLEEIGETIEQINVTVSYCPYCGAKLNNQDNPLVSYSHHDFSHWR